MDGRHCDDIADDPKTPACVSDFLNHARAPAHGSMLDTPRPPLFAKHDGKPVRVVMASRFGDVGITEKLDAENGYSLRVMVGELSDFTATI